MINLSAADLVSFLLLIPEDKILYLRFFIGVSWLDKLADCEPFGKVQNIT